MKTLITFLIISLSLGVFAKKISDDDLTIGDKTTSEKTITLGKSGQNIIRVPSGGGNIEISNNGGSSFDEISAGEQPNEPDTVSNGAILTSVAAKALTVALKQSDASTDATAADPVRISLRVTPVTSGAYNSRTVTSSLSLVVPSGATLNHADGADGFIYVYVLDFSSVLELAVSSSRKDDSVLQTTIALSAGSDADALYSTTLRSNVPIRLIARLKSNQVTAGTWALNMSEISPGDDLSDSFNSRVEHGHTSPLIHATLGVDDVAGTPTIIRERGAWVDSITDLGAGDYTVNLTTGFFDGATTAECTCTSINAGSSNCTVQPAPTTIGVRTRVNSSDALTDSAFGLVCTGQK